MRLYHIVAVAENRVIGRNNQLPWHFPEDLKQFKKLTMGSTVIMGRKTFESLGNQPLPNRENFVLTHSHLPVEKQENLKFFESLNEAIAEVSTAKAFIIGGAEVFRQTIDKVDGIYLTKINGNYEGDAYYPEIPTYFKAISRTQSSETPQLEFIFYENTKKK